MQITLRPASETDLPLLGQMNRRLIEDEHSRNPMNAAQLEQRMRGLWAQGYLTRLFVDASGRTLGYALYRVLPDDYYPDQQFVYLRQFYVERDVRRRGVGTRALALLLEEFPIGAAVALDVLASNPAGRAFWESAGFVPYCTTMHLHPGCSTAVSATQES